MESVDTAEWQDKNQAVIFTLPDKSEFEGIVHRTGSNIYELEIDDLPKEPWAVIDRLEARAKKEDDKYLFLNARYAGSSSRMNRTSSSSSTIFRPTTTLHTNEPDNPLSQNITSLSTNVENLDLWLNRSLFNFHNPMHMQDSMDYKLGETVGEYKFKGFTLRLGLSIGGMRFARFTRAVKLNQVANIELRSDEHDQPYTVFIEALRSIERLLGLAFLMPITSGDVDVTSKDFHFIVGETENPSIFPAYSIVLSNVRQATPIATYPDELTFTLDQLGDFQELLDKWSELEENILPIVDLFLASTSGGNTVLENKFLNRVQAVEAFHRAFRHRNLIPGEDYTEQIERIISQFSGKDRNLLKKTLKYGNQLSLGNRLTELDKELKLIGMPTIMVCSLDVVANTRNYYSHYENDIKNICPIEKLGELTHQCGEMLLALILTELGLRDDIVRRAIRNINVL